MNEEPLESEVINIIIPECCREGHDDCPHVLKRDKPKKGNIAV